MMEVRDVPWVRCLDCKRERLHVSGKRWCELAHRRIEEPEKTRQCMYFERKERK